MGHVELGFFIVYPQLLSFFVVDIATGGKATGNTHVQAITNSLHNAHERNAPFVILGWVALQ